MGFNFEIEPEDMTLEDYKSTFVNVYNEEDVHEGQMRVWVSFDINKDTDNSKHAAIKKCFIEDKLAETWGGSVFTYLEDIMDVDSLKRSIVKLLQKWHLLRDDKWEQTKGISIYVIWRRHTKQGGKSSGYFTLIQNADVPYLEDMIKARIK